ncbi:DUF6177 family protein, partial [Streptomyces torulosus]
PPTSLGPTTRPALHYPLGDGEDPASWERLQKLTQHLRSPAGGRSGS